jgi:parvulin-like peptidyl-prolyl isomerase
MKVIKDDCDIAFERGIRFIDILIFIFIGLLLLSSVFVYKNIYINHNNTNVTRIIADVLPLPAGIVNSDFLMYEDIFALDQLAVIEFPDEDHFSYAINAAIKEKVLNQMVDELGIEFRFDNSDDINEDVYLQYNWDKQEYIDHILIPMQQSEILQDAVLSCSDYQQSVKIEMEHVISLINMGIGFDDLAKQYSQIASSQFGGDIGYLKQDELNEGLNVLWDYNVNQNSGIVELSDRFIIAKVYDVVENEGVREQIGIQMIVMYKNGLQEVLGEEKQKANIKIF